MRLVGKNSVNDLSVRDAHNIHFNCISEDDKWRVNIINELIEYRYNAIDIDNFSNSEINDILRFVCTS